MKKQWLLAMGLSTIIAGCSNEKDYYQDPAANLKPESEYFDFATTSNVTFDVNYGKIGSGALIEIFTEDPVTYDENSSYVTKGEAVYKIFADKDGRFVGEVELPKATKSVYIFSPTWGVPMCVEATVENGKVTYDGTSRDLKGTKATKANDKLTIWSVTGHDGLYTIAQWEESKFGKITDPNGLTSTGSMLSQDITTIQHSLWNGKTSKPGDLDNSKHATDTKHVNTTIAKAYKNEDGKTVNIENAEIWLTFVAEAGWHQNAIGYYYYPSDKEPTDLSKVKKYILFPNTSTAGNAPYMYKKPNKYNKEKDKSWYDFGYDNAPLTTNTRIQLLYVNESGETSTKFPAGYTIGYFILPKKYTNYNNNREDTYQLPNNGYIYSNKAWNKNKKSNFIALTYKNFIVYGVEDGGDNSYEDVLFTIEANPHEAIQDPERPVIDPETPVITETENTVCTYAYEDIWPTGGDYDLNDVIIEHKREITFNNKDGKNNVEKVVDTYTPVQPSGSATYVDAFAVQYPQRGSIELPANAIDEGDESGTVILFSDAKTVKGQDFVVTRTFNDSSMPKEELSVSMKDLNPFIIANYAEGQSTRTEIHMPKAKATDKANADQIGKEDDAYYINKDGKHPFGIMIPARNFTPVSETINIEKEYPKFKSWVESNGTTDNEWYIK